MTRQVLYVAHPLAPTAEDIAAIKALHGQSADSETSELRCRQALELNLQRALRWLAWLRKSFPETTFIAPWIATITSLDGDDSPELREAGLVDDCAVVERCDGIVLCGGRISSGMRREMEHGKAHRRPAFEERFENPFKVRAPFKVYDLTCPANPDPPLTCGPLWMPLVELARVARDLWR
jgi:hypothetical protein